MFKQLFRFAQSPITYQDDVALKKFITRDPCANIVREVLKDPNKVVDFEYLLRDNNDANLLVRILRNARQYLTTAKTSTKKLI